MPETIHPEDAAVSAAGLVSEAIGPAADLVSVAAVQAQAVVDSAAGRAITVVDAAAGKADDLIASAAAKAVTMVQDAATTASIQIQEQTAALNRSLGRVEGIVERLVKQAEDSHQEFLDAFTSAAEHRAASDAVISEHLVHDAIAFEKIELSLQNMTGVMERIRKPIDTYLSLKKISIGLVALMAAAGTLLIGLPNYILHLPHIIYQLFHPPS